MAPSRRKGAAKAAAAAAARRQWKVGDLVLAKVKGFPAWPATVSEPEKWGYSADWKKVLVYFFGTQQIAFCNPADVEAFTEEKKQTLLIKRQGKGADFVRAVQEIIESYEKSKLQQQIDISKSTDGVTIANGENSMDPLQDLGEASGATLDSQSKASDSCKAKNDQSLPTEDASAAEQIVALRDNATCETHNKCAVVKETPILTTYSSRKRSGGLRAQKSVTQRKAPSTRRSRSSSRVESHRCQSFTTQCNDGDQSAGDMSANVIQDGGLRRNKRIRKLPGGSEWEYMGSAALMSNGSIEDNGSEIATVDSDNVSLNEGSAIESDCKLGHSDNVLECLEGDVELSKGLDFQIKAVVIKKKRKPNRKRGANDAAEPPVKMDVEADLQTGVKNTCQNSQNSCENSNERFSKENGDEHLPLVKRARVRMSKSLSTEEDVKTSSQVEGEAAKEVTVNMSGEVSLSAIGDNDNCVVEEAKSLSQSEEKALRVAVNMPSAINGSHNRTDGDSFVAAEVLDNISSPKVSTQSSGDTPTDIDSSIEKRAVYIVSPSKACTRPQLWKVAKTQFGCSADGEAALPPSKRLHRAMEAMSANAVEEGQTFAEASSTMKTIINESCGPSLRYSQKINESRQGSNQELDTVTSFTNSTSGFCCSSNPILSEESSKSSAEEEILKQPIECSAIQKHESCEDVSVEPMDPACSKDHGGSAFDACSVQTVVQSQLPQSLLPQSPSLPSKDKMSVENANFSMFRAEKPDKEVHMSRHAEMSQNPVVPSNEIANISVQDGEDLLKWNAERTDSEDLKSLKPQIDGNGQVNSVCEIVEDIKIEQTQKNTRSLPNCNDHLSDKLSPSPTNIVDSPARGSPPVTSICHMSTAESANTIQNNGCSPSVTLHDKKNLSAMVVDEEAKGETLMAQKPKTIGKWSNNAEAHAAISSFEATLAILTRTKESIGRATRMAIDCAKFGDSSKVVEILVRNLECESSLHRRVDLFFLVDSITQCSRGLKGDVGGIYPSAIQAALPRLLAAAAPPGAVAQENRRQCLKVLRLWLERRILPETVIRHHMRELDSLSSSSSAGPFSRRSARTERALDDPVRDMEGMLVDEYGSNSTFQLPGFCMPRMLKDEDEGSDSDGGSFEAVTPEHKSELHEEREPMPAIGRHRHILEDVDGELEMEDVAPSCEVEVSSSNNVAGVNTTQTSHGQFSLAFAPPLPQDVPPSSPPLPSSPPPPAPPPPPPPPPLPLSAMTDSNANGVDSEFCQNMHEDSQHSAGLQSVTPIINAAMSTNALHYRGPDYRDLQRPNPISDSTSSFNSFPVHPTNSVQQSDGPSFHHKPYPPRPPQPAPSDQFSYIQAGQHVKSRKDEPPPCYTHRSHFMPNVDSGNFYDNHERMKPNIDSGNFYDNHERMKPNIDSGNFYDNQDRMRPAPYEYRERWRFPEAPFSGPRYFDKARGSFMPGSYAGPPCETTRYSNNRWAYPPRPMNHRNSYPMRPPPEDAVPVGLRAPSIWRPR